MTVPPSTAGNSTKRLFLAVQTKFYSDTSGRLRTEHGYARYESWLPFLGAMDEITLLARVADATRDTGALVEGPGVHVIMIPFYAGTLGFLRRYRELKRFFQHTLTDPLALYGARASDPIGPLVRRRARRLGAQFFLQVVGDPEDVLRSGVAGRLGRIAARSIRRIVAREARNADGVIYVTRKTLQRKYPAGAGKPTAVRSNVELSAKNMSAAPRDYQVRPVAKPVRLVAVGTHDQPYKGHDTLIDAMALFARHGLEATASIIGDGKRHDTLLRRAKKLGVSRRIDFVGYLPNAALVREYFLQADLFVLPSHTEGLSRALIEAMATGIACIGSSAGGTPELLPAICLFAPRSPGDLERVVRQLVDSPTLMTEVARQGWETAHEVAQYYSGTTVLTEFLASLRAGARPTDQRKSC